MIIAAKTVNGKSGQVDIGSTFQEMSLALGLWESFGKGG